MLHTVSLSHLCLTLPLPPLHSSPFSTPIASMSRLFISSSSSSSSMCSNSRSGHGVSRPSPSGAIRGCCSVSAALTLSTASIQITAAAVRRRPARSSTTPSMSSSFSSQSSSIVPSSRYVSPLRLLPPDIVKQRPAPSHTTPGPESHFSLLNMIKFIFSEQLYHQNGLK